MSDDGAVCVCVCVLQTSMNVHSDNTRVTHNSAASIWKEATAVKDLPVQQQVAALSASHSTPTQIVVKVMTSRIASIQYMAVWGKRMTEGEGTWMGGV